MLPTGQGVMPPEAEERRFELMRSYSTPATQVDGAYMPGISGFVPWGRTHVGNLNADGTVTRAAELSAQLAVQAEEQGDDALCPWGIQDVGVREARQRVRIPVVGQAEACLLALGALGQPFGSCTYMPGGDERIQRQADEAGVGHLHVSHTNIGIPNSEYPQRHDEVLEQFVRCAWDAQAAGAKLMGLVAMSICPGEFTARELTEATGGFPVLDAMACQIAMAEWWHRTGLPPTLLKMPRD
jgi:Asp/Glu/hydantoin racemase